MKTGNGQAVYSVELTCQVRGQERGFLRGLLTPCLSGSDREGGHGLGEAG